MEFTCSIVINKPQKQVAEYFANPLYLKEYQDGFLRKELQSGTAGEDGAISNMYYKQGKREMLLEETILKNELPESFFANYHHEHMDNTMCCVFTAMDEQTTRYDSTIHYTAFRGFLPKLMAKFFPSIFKKQVKKWMVNFKAFVEAE